jgi:hypothetical protein
VTEVAVTVCVTIGDVCSGAYPVVQTTAGSVPV